MKIPINLFPLIRKVNEFFMSGFSVIRRKSTSGMILPCIMAIFCNNIKSQDVVYSPEFNAFIKQIQTIYCQPVGKNYEEIRKKDPQAFGTITGHALRQQLLTAQKNNSLKHGYDLLQQETMRYVFESLRKYQYHLTNGQAMKEADIWKLVNDGINGAYDELILKDFKVAQGSTPSVLLANATPRNGEGQSLGKLHTKEEKETAITLLNVEAPKVEYERFVINEDYYDKGFKWDDVLGTWQDFEKEEDYDNSYIKDGPPFCTLRITKEKSGDTVFYVGKVTGRSSKFSSYFRCKDDGTMFRVQAENPFNYPCIIGRYCGDGYGDTYGKAYDKNAAEWTDYYRIFMEPSTPSGWILSVLGNYASKSSNYYRFKKTGN